jgi:hypothetical protein
LAGGDLIFNFVFARPANHRSRAKRTVSDQQPTHRCNKEYRASASLDLDQFNVSHFAKNQDRPKAVSLHAIGFAFDQAAPVAAGRWRR